MHNWDNATSLKETLRTFNDLIRCGKIRHIGVCNFAGHHLQKCVDYCEFMGLDPVINIQVRHGVTRHHLMSSCLWLQELWALAHKRVEAIT